MASFDIRITNNRLPGLPGRLREKADALVRRTALAIEGATKENIEANRAVDTGAYLNSTAAITSREDHYPAAVAEAQARRPGVQCFPHPEQPAEMQAVVVQAVHYAIYQEMGTVRMHARPAMAPAVERVRPSFDAGCQSLIEQAVRG